eukprot:3283466-Lingulodinium_polyedra.AAC.1
MQAFKEEYKKLASTCAQKSQQPTPKSKGVAKKKSKRVPKAHDEDAGLMDENSARQFMPPIGKIYKDFYNRRWLAVDTSIGASRS